jgi:hypothetical protein
VVNVFISETTGRKLDSLLSHGFILYFQITGEQAYIPAYYDQFFSQFVIQDYLNLFQPFAASIVDSECRHDINKSDLSNVYLFPRTLSAV